MTLSNILLKSNINDVANFLCKDELHSFGIIESVGEKDKKNGIDNWGKRWFDSGLDTRKTEDERAAKRIEERDRADWKDTRNHLIATAIGLAASGYEIADHYGKVAKPVGAYVSQVTDRAKQYLSTPSPTASDNVFDMFEMSEQEEANFRKNKLRELKAQDPTLGEKEVGILVDLENQRRRNNRPKPR